MSVTIIPIPDEFPKISRPHLNTNFANLKAAVEALQGRFLVQSLIWASTIATDASLGSTVEVAELIDDTTLANPTNGADGQVVIWYLKQDSTGGRTITLGNKFVIPSSATTPLGWSTTPGTCDLFAAKYRLALNKWDVISLLPGVTP